MHTQRVHDVDAPAWMDKERALTSRAKAGDRAAFHELYDIFGEPILSFLRSKLRDKDMAKDVAADVFHSAWASRHTFDPAGRSYWFWLHRIADNKARNAQRDAQRSGRAFTGWGRMHEPANMDGVERQIDLPKLKAKVVATIAQIPNANYRRALTLELVDQHPRERSAELMQLKVATFNVTLFRAHAEFRKLWTEAA